MGEFRKIGICGAGTMGSGIAQVAANAGFATIQFDVNKEMLAKSKATIEKNLQWLVVKGKINESQKDECLARITFTDHFSDCVADIIIEAIIEKKAAKIELFTKLATVNTGDTVFASNTSSIAITEIASAISNPGRVIGMHFFNPAPVMKLVEVIKAPQTTDNVVEAVKTLAIAMGKTPVVCADSPGFIVNRVARQYYLEAMKLVEEGLATIETVDAIMESTGFKLGPFKLMDLIGLDINYSVSSIVWDALGRPERLKPSAIQKEKVEAGDLGRKSGRGFYSY